LKSSKRSSTWRPSGGRDVPCGYSIVTVHRRTCDTETEPERQRGPPKPPVEEGEQRTVEIEDIGDQGDGITRVERGFVVIVSDTDQGERVTIEITDIRENVAFAEVVERVSYYE
jgi:predicted RNA-binding protein with TRAM domain